MAKTFKDRCNIPTTIAAALAHEVKHAPDPARPTNNKVNEAFEAGLTQESHYLMDKLKQAATFAREAVFVLDRARKSFDAIGDKEGITDLMAMMGRHSASSKAAFDDTLHIVEKWMAPAQNVTHVKEAYRVLWLKSNIERSKRGLEVSRGLSLRELEAALAETSSKSSKESLAMADGIFEGLRVIGRELEDAGLLARGTVKKDGNYVPHDVIDFLDKDVKLLAARHKGGMQFSHGMQAEGSTRDIQSNFQLGLHHYVVTAKQKIADNKFRGEVIARFGKPAEFHPSGEVKVPTDPNYGIYHMDASVRWEGQRVLRALYHANEAGYIQLMKKINPGLSEAEASALYRQGPMSVSGKGKLIELPTGLIEELHSRERMGESDGIARIIHQVTRGVKRQLAGRIGLYTGIRHFRDMRGDIQALLRDDPSAIALSGDVAKRLMGKVPGKVLKHLVMAQAAVPSGVAKAVSKAKFTDDEFKKYYQEAHDNGVLMGRYVTETKGAPGTERPSLLKEYARLTGNKKAAAAAKVAKQFEDADAIIEQAQAIYRLSKYIRDRQRGASIAEAAKRNGDTFINYSMVTPLEQAWFRDAMFPFYTWMKGNARAWMRPMLNRKDPRAMGQAWATFMAFSAIPVAWNYWMDPEEEERIQNDKRNKFLARTPHINTGLRQKDGSYIYITDPLPHADIERIFNFSGMYNNLRQFYSGDSDGAASLAKIGGDLVSQVTGATGGAVVEALNPIFRLPLELQQNRNFFYNMPIANEAKPGYVQFGQKAHHVARSVDRQLSTFEGLFFNKASAPIDAARLLGIPVNAFGNRQSKTNKQIAEESIFGVLRKPRAPTSKDEMIEHVTKYMGKVDDSDIKHIEDNYKQIRARYQQILDEYTKARVIRRHELIARELESLGMDSRLADIHQLPDATREALIEKVQDKKWFKQLTSVSEKDRRLSLQQALAEAGLK